MAATNGSAAPAEESQPPTASSPAAAAAGAAAGEEEEPNLSQQQIIERYKEMRTRCQELAEKGANMRQDLEEHQSVIRRLSSMDSGRKAYRLLGGVLTEQTVGEVLPAVTSTAANITAVVNQTEADLARLDAETKAWKVKYGIRTQAEVEAERAAAGRRAA
eukprot:CAMPEP_0198428650 /NCGR_PEP_ID=MMETSP1452-20131203/6690_1 /TAXON_ID=1181717 /ORGANISM="Synchroma pusillum, Strain CCMP3072" /LENGTH=160 /DNA_ID=CAMNT_0044149047 /DNA_START=20 /DNA_END=502 /DNA_ORIENTATION=+